MIQNQPVILDSVEVSSKVFDGGDVHSMMVLAEARDLVSCIVNVSSRALIEEVEFSNNRKVLEPMVEGRR